MSVFRCSISIFSYFEKYSTLFISGNHVQLPRPNSKRNTGTGTSNLVLIIFVLLLCGAYILGAISISKYQGLRNDVSQMNNAIDEKEVAGESSTSNQSDSSPFLYNLSCEDDPCKNNGTCVTVIHAGYYCICNSERFHGRHCENGDDKDSLFIYFSLSLFRKILSSYNYKNTIHTGLRYSSKAKNHLESLHLINIGVIFNVFSIN